jgi:hypothetical protein
MGVSVVRVLILTAFLVLGMVMAGVFTQPKASIDVWNIKDGDFPADGSGADKMTFLLNYAILAPSSYNTQPWRFNVSGDEIRLYADRTRWLTVADADKRELNIGLGCALENLAVASDHFGYSCNISYPPGNGSLVAVIKLMPDNKTPKNTMLFDAMTASSTSRYPYENRTIEQSDLQMLHNLGTDDGVLFYTTSNAEAKNEFSDLAVRADQMEYASSDFKSELGYWLGQGMMGPTGAEAKIAQITLLFLDTGADRAKEDALLVSSAPMLGFICSDGNDRTSQIRAGQTFERVRLAAAAMGVCINTMSQVLEQQQIKAETSGLLPPGSGYLQQAFLLGYAAQADEHTPKIPVQDLIVREDRPPL